MYYIIKKFIQRLQAKYKWICIHAYAQNVHETQQQQQQKNTLNYTTKQEAA